MDNVSDISCIFMNLVYVTLIECISIYIYCLDEKNQNQSINQSINSKINKKKNTLNNMRADLYGRQLATVYLIQIEGPHKKNAF